MFDLIGKSNRALLLLRLLGYLLVHFLHLSFVLLLLQLKLHFHRRSLLLEMDHLVLRDFVVEDISEHIYLIVKDLQFIKERAMLLLHFGNIDGVSHIFWQVVVVLVFPWSVGRNLFWWLWITSFTIAAVVGREILASAVI